MPYIIHNNLHLSRYMHHVSQKCGSPKCCRWWSQNSHNQAKLTLYITRACHFSGVAVATHSFGQFFSHVKVSSWHLLTRPWLISITFLGWRQKNVTVLQPEISFLAPALHKSLRLPNVKQVAKQNPLRFGPGLWDSVYGLAWWTNILIYTNGFLGYWQIGNWLCCFRKKINACLHHLITSIHTNQQYLPWFKRSCVSTLNTFLDFAMDLPRSSKKW